jgi:hypothetical protein
VKDQAEYKLPVWAPRLRKSQIETLYTSCAKGLVDEELIDDVGFSLYVRCMSILEVGEAVHGRPRCPNCETSIERGWEPDAILECPNCGWKCPAKIYQKTYQRKNLNAGGMKAFIEEFIQKFQNTRSHRDRLVLIDTLIHRYHWNSSESRPGACGLIQGRMKDVMAFLDKLNYGDQMPEGIKHTREEWRKKWSSNPWSKGRGQ